MNMWGYNYGNAHQDQDHERSNVATTTIVLSWLSLSVPFSSCSPVPWRRMIGVPANIVKEHFERAVTRMDLHQFAKARRSHGGPDHHRRVFIRFIWHRSSLIEQGLNCL